MKIYDGTNLSQHSYKKEQNCDVNLSKNYTFNCFPFSDMSSALKKKTKEIL